VIYMDRSGRRNMQRIRVLCGGESDWLEVQQLCGVSSRCFRVPHWSKKQTSFGCLALVPCDVRRVCPPASV
jgi:hypothetical protein